MWKLCPTSELGLEQLDALSLGQSCTQQMENEWGKGDIVPLVALAQIRASAVQGQGQRNERLWQLAPLR